MTSSGKTLITIIRHGETEWNKLGFHQGVLDSPLTKTGIEQAQKVSQLLQKYSFQKFYSSDLGRAVWTAEIIAAALKLDIIFDPQLREQNLGYLGGLTLAEFKAAYPGDCEKYLSGDPDYTLPDGESNRHAYHRSVSCFEDLAAKHKNESILVVTHGLILEYLFRYALGIPLQKARNFRLKNCSINRFLRTENGWVLDTWGETDYK